MDCEQPDGMALVGDTTSDFEMAARSLLGPSLRGGVFLGLEAQDEGSQCTLTAWDADPIVDEQTGDDDFETPWLPSALQEALSEAVRSNWTQAKQVPMGDGTMLHVAPTANSETFQSLVVVQAAQDWGELPPCEDPIQMLPALPMPAERLVSAQGVTQGGTVSLYQVEGRLKAGFRRVITASCDRRGLPLPVHPTAVIV